MQNNKKPHMHVVFLSSWYPTRVQPTNGDFVVRHAHAVSTFCKTSVIHVAYDENLTTYMQLHQNNSSTVSEYIYYFRLPRLVKWLKPFWFLLVYRNAFCSYISKFGKPQVVHVNVMFPIVLVAFLCKLLYGIPYVITEHWTGYLASAPQSLGRMKKWYVRFFSRANSRIMPVSNDLQRALQMHGITGEYSVIQNVVDTSIFYPSKQKDTSQIKILHVSHLRDEHKNISGILRVCAQVFASNPNVVLQIVSENSPSYMHEYIHELGIQNNVQFLGYKNRQELAQVLREASYLLLFSNYENFPCVIVEALASGIPVVSSNVGGISEHISEQNGVLVEPKNEIELYDAILRMNALYTQYDSSVLHTYAVKHFSYESVGEHMYTAYQEICKI